MTNLLPILDTQKHLFKLPSTKETIEYRPYLVKEEKQLLIAMESNEPHTVFRVLRDICVTCSFGALDPDKHTEFDLESLFLNIRARSTGEISNIVTYCSECDADNPVAIDLTTIELPDIVNNNQSIEILPQIHVVMKYPSINQAIAFESVRQTKTDNRFDYMFAKIANHVDQIHHGENVFHADDGNRDDIISFLDELPIPVFQKIDDYFKDAPAIKYNMMFDCQNCGKENNREITGYQNFFV